MRKRQFNSLLAEVQALRAVQMDCLQVLTALLSTSMRGFAMFSSGEQKIVDAVNTSTTKTGTAITAATTAIKNLVDQHAAGDINAQELSDAIQPSLDALDVASDALSKTATTADPLINPSASPLPVVPVVPAVE
jgi:hypothetical protein